MKLVFALTLTMLSGICYAQTSVEQSQSMQSAISQSQKESAAVWGLTAEEWILSEKLRADNSGMVSSQLSPLELLGIFATDPHERQRYAEMLAARQLEIIDSVRKFEQFYMKAIQQLAARSNPRNSQSNRMILVTPHHCIDSKCKESINIAIEHALSGGGVDIYIRETLSNAQMRMWVTSNRIPVDLIRSRNITISHAHGRTISLADGIFRFD